MAASEPKRDIVVIGASLGGLSALSEVVSGLPRDLPAALFAVLHSVPTRPDLLSRILGERTKLEVQVARDGAPFRQGALVVPAPDRHLLLDADCVRVGAGAPENRSRPAIDPLFRSAAITHRSRVIGVVLTGLLDDGSSGLRAIKSCGGLAIVQDPDDCEAPDMPRNALHATEVDHRLPASEIAGLLISLCGEPAPEPPSVPREVEVEARIARAMLSDVEAVRELGVASANSCPDCGGPLWHIRDGAQNRFRCHVGHAYTEPSLLAAQSDESIRALTVALRTLEERSRMFDQMARTARERGSRLHEMYERRADEARDHVQAIQQLLEVQ